MIYLEKGQKVFEKPELVVYEPTGERNDMDMVICAQKETPDEPFCWLEAQYIAYGNIVYSISDDKELEKEILKMDPDSTINDVMIENQNTLVQNIDPVQEPPQQSPSQNVIQQPAPSASSTPSIGEPMAAQQQTNVSTTTAPVAPVEVPVTSATSSEVVVDPVASSSPAVTPSAPVDPVSTSTPDVVPDTVPEPIPAPVLDIPVAPIEGATASTSDATIISMAKRKGRKKVV